MKEKPILTRPPLENKTALICLALVALATGLILLFFPHAFPPPYSANPGWVFVMTVVLTGALSRAPGFGFGLMLFVIFLETPASAQYAPSDDFRMFQAIICTLVLMASVVDESNRRRREAPPTGSKTPQAG